MRQLLYSMIVSLDGYVADRDGQFDWAVPDEEVLTAVNEDTAKVGTFLYGRNMNEMMKVWETDPTVAAQSPRSQDFARLWKNTEKIVYSTTLATVSTARTHLRQRFDPEEVRRLKEFSTADLSVDGPTLAATAMGSGLVDQLHLLVCPIVLGGGLPYLPDLRMELSLRREQRFGNGMVQLQYDVDNSPA